MKKTERILSLIDEAGPQYRTLMREGCKNGSRHARNIVENAVKVIKKMVQEGNGCPSPADSISESTLKDCEASLCEVANRLKKVKDKK